MKKILTLLALMIATVAVVATGYKLTRPAKAAGDVVNYTDQMTAKGGWAFGDSPVTTTDVAATVTDKGDGTYDIVFPALALETESMGKMGFSGDVEFPAVPGTVDSKGYIVFDGTSNNMTVTGKSKDGKLYLELHGSFYYMSDIDLVYGTAFPEEPDEPAVEIPEGTKVGEDGYAAGGTAFCWDNNTINWDTQKLVALVDVSTCTGTNEDIFSVGETIANWSPGAHVHFYYTRSTKSLEIDYLDNNNGNYVRKQLTVDGDQLLFEISKENGFTVNGENFNYKNGGSLLTDFATEYAPFWALTTIQVGGCQGDNMSNATYKYVRIVDLAKAPEAVVYTDAAQATYGGTTTDNADQTVEITETAEGKYTVVYKQLILGSNAVADFTATDVAGTTDEDGYVNYTFEGEATLTNVNATYAMMGMLSEGQTVPFTITGKSKDGKLQAKFTTTVLSKEGVVLFGGYTEPVKPTVYTDKLVLAGSYPGTVAAATLNVYDNGDGTYKFEFPELNVDGLGLLGDVVVPSVPGTVAEDGTITFAATDVEFDVEGADAATTSVSGQCKDGKMYVVFTCKLYGEDETITFGTPFAKPAVTYTDKFVYTIMDYETTKDEYTISVTDNGDGTYKFEMPSVGMYNVTFPAVPGTVNEDGTISYEGTNVEGTVNSDGDKCTMNITGKSDGTKLYLYCDGKILEFDGVNRFVFGTPFKTVEPGRVIGEDEYEPNGTAFSYDDITIDWDKEYFEASIDLSSCQNSFENILSIGESISNWGGGNRLHFFYTASTHTLQPNFMAPDNVSRFNIKLDGDQLLIQLSKRHGLVINGQPALYTYNDDSNTTGETYADLDAYLEATKTFWALASYSVGSTQGDTRSNAKYNYIRVKELPAEEPKIESTETFTDQLVTTDASQTRHTMADKTLDINKYTDGTYGVTFHGVETANDVLGDITVKGIEVTETEDGTIYNGENLTAVINDENSSLNGKEVKVTVTGQKDKDGKVLFMFEITCDDDPNYLVVGEFGTEGGGGEEGTKYYGTWDLTSPESTFNGNVTAINNEDGTYSFDVENFTLNGAEVGNFTVKNVPATTAADGSVTLGNNYDTYEVEYKGATPDDAITSFQYVTGYIKNGKLHLVTSYVNYGTGTNRAYYVVFDGTDVPNGINGINADELNGNAQIFTIGGARVNSLQKGINIVRVNGKTMKVVKK